MVLVDTSVWVAHLKEGDAFLASLLNDGDVICHALIIGELACGSLKRRSEILSLLQALPMAVETTHAEILHFIDHYHLMGKGLGYIDVHLLASALISNATLWTFDKPLKTVADRIGIGFKTS